jgi:hypothetical protein
MVASISRRQFLSSAPTVLGGASIPIWLGELAFGWFYRPKGENDKYARQIRSSAGIAVFVGQAADKAHWMVGKEMTVLPWEGSWSNYQTRDGMTVPITGEAAWLRPEGRKPYFLGTVTSLTYEFSP